MKLFSKHAILFLLGCSVSLFALDVTPEFKIVSKDLRGKVDLEAVKVLSEHLAKIFGKVPGTANVPGAEKTIVLTGDNSLGDEEWIIRSDGKNLYISGGKPRGLYYGICEFLEKFAGVRYFTKTDILIPKAARITVPDGKQFRRKPAFPIQRKIYTDVEFGKDNDYFFAFNKATCTTAANHPDDLHTSAVADGCHNFWIYTKLIPENRPDMLPVDANGKRVRATSGMGPGQICFSNKEFRELVKKEVGRRISARKAYAKQLGITEKSTISMINLSQNDNSQFCQCAGCKGLYKKYGAISGGLLEFINDIASAYPETLFETFAYLNTEIAPKGIVPRDNVVIQFALIGRPDHWYDLLRPLSHPLSHMQRDVYESWRNIVKRKSIWGYHRMYHMTEAFPWPQACFWSIAEDIRFYEKFGAERIFIESEYNRDSYCPRAFHDLHIYLSAKLMDDPSLDDKKLIREFMEHQYGPAAPAMMAYARHLQKTIESYPNRICEFPLYARSYMNLEFFREIEKNLKEAERLAAGNETILKRIAVERIPVDFALLNLWDRIGSKLYSFRQTVADRLEKNVKIAWGRYQPHPYNKYYNTKGLETFNKTLSAVNNLRAEATLPEEFSGKECLQFVVALHAPVDSVKDPEATMGRAIKRGNMPGHKLNHDKVPMEFGIYDQAAKKVILKKVLSSGEVAQDEKYHLINIGKYIMPGKITPYQMWGHASWSMGLTRLISNLWNPADVGTVYDVWVSAKLTGPAYVKGSKKENAAYVDRVIFVKVSAPVLPEGISAKDAIQSFAVNVEGELHYTDKDAAFETALKFEKISNPKYDPAKVPMEFGIYDITGKKVLFKKVLTPEEIAQDEKYHLIEIGTFRCKRNGKYQFWAHASWGFNINRLLKPAQDAVSGETVYRVFISCKFTGSAYVKNSKNKNAIYVDRAIFIKQ